MTPAAERRSPASGTCTFGVIFTPSQTGTRTGKIVVTDDASIPSQSITVSGVGYIVTPTVSPKSVTYGRVQVNNISPPQTVTLSNSNVVAINFTSIATSGPFAITANGCGTSVPAKSSCQVSVTFNPTTDSNANGTTETGRLTFIDNGQVSTQNVTLSGVAFGTVSTATPTVDRDANCDCHRWHADGQRDCDRRNTNCDGHADLNQNGDCDRNGDSNGDCDRHGYGDRNLDFKSDRNRYPDCDLNRNLNR